VPWLRQLALQGKATPRHLAISAAVAGLSMLVSTLLDPRAMGEAEPRPVGLNSVGAIRSSRFVWTLAFSQLEQLTVWQTRSTRTSLRPIPPHLALMHLARLRTSRSQSFQRISHANLLSSITRRRHRSRLVSRQSGTRHPAWCPSRKALPCAWEDQRASTRCSCNLRQAPDSLHPRARAHRSSSHPSHR